MVQSFYVWRIYNRTKNIWVSLIIEVVSTWMPSFVPVLNSFSRLLLSNVFSLGISVSLYELLFVCTSALAESWQVTVHGRGVEKLLAVSPEVSVRVYASSNLDSGVFWLDSRCGSPEVHPVMWWLHQRLSSWCVIQSSPAISPVTEANY